MPGKKACQNIRHRGKAKSPGCKSMLHCTGHDPKASSSGQESWRSFCRDDIGKGYVEQQFLIYRSIGF